MKKNIEKVIEIPENVQVEVGKEVVVKSAGKEIRKKMSLSGIKIAKEGNKIKVFCERATRNESKLIGTAVAHIKKMLDGVKEDFVYKLEICNVHFPMTLKVEGNKLVIKNFLGETVDRVANIVKNAKVEVKGTSIVVSSPDKDAAGQTAANIEIATKIRLRDRRIFQDGIFITEKCGAKL